MKLMIRETMITEKEYPVIIAKIAICLLVLLPAMTSDSFVVNPQEVSKEMAWNNDFSPVNPVILKRNEKILIKMA